MDENFKYIYGPVYSWRLGMSLGVDPLSDRHKICNLDCIYCQLGKTRQWSNERKEYVPTHEIVNEIINLSSHVKMNHITICGRGEPTLAKNLGAIIDSIREVRTERIAVITNSTLMNQKDVRRDLLKADFVLAKMDGFDQNSFSKVDKSEFNFENILNGIKLFRGEYRGKLALQIMFIDQNKKYAQQIADVAKGVGANEIEINTPLRPSACRPLSRFELDEVRECFGSLPAITVYDKERKYFEPMNEKETIQRHGNYKHSYAGEER